MPACARRWHVSHTSACDTAITLHHTAARLVQVDERVEFARIEMLSEQLIAFFGTALVHVPLLRSPRSNVARNRTRYPRVSASGLRKVLAEGPTATRLLSETCCRRPRAGTGARLDGGLPFSPAHARRREACGRACSALGLERGRGGRRTSLATGTPSSRGIGRGGRGGEVDKKTLKVDHSAGARRWNSARRLEPTIGLEPMTCRLRSGCSSGLDRGSSGRITRKYTT